MIPSLIAYLAILVTPPGSLDDTDARTAYSGSVGPDGWPLSEDCAEWAAARQKGGKRAAPLESWVAGVITGYNFYHASSVGDRLDLLDGKKLSDAYIWIDQRCSATPDRGLPDVTLELVEEWRRR
jgi:hypothetical protein